MLSNPTILVFTDFKQPSDFALKSAEVIRKKVGGKIHVTHVSDLSVQCDWISQEASYIFQSERLTLDLLKSLEKMMAEQIRRCEVECTSNVTLGLVYAGLMDSIAKTKPDIVFMGHKVHSHGLFNLGGIVAKIVASSSVPVFVTKKVLSTPVGKIAGLVDPCDLTQPIISTTEELSFVLSAEPEIISLWRKVKPPFPKIAPFDNSSLTKTDEEEKDIVLSGMKSAISKNLDTHTKCKIKVGLTEELQVAYHLVNILQEDQVDVAIMQRHQKKIMDRMMIGSETKRMIELFTGNLLVLPPGEHHV